MDHLDLFSAEGFDIKTKMIGVTNRYNEKIC